MLGGLGMPELIVILVIVVLIFGVGKLPELGAGMGKAIRNFKKGVRDTQGELEDKGSGSEIRSEEKTGREEKVGR